MAEIDVDMPDLSGEAGPFTLFLRNGAGALLNAGGDALSEVEDPPGTKTGVWKATVAEAISEDHRVRVYEGVAEVTDDIVFDGGIASGETHVRPAWPIAASGGGGDVSSFSGAAEAKLNAITNAVASALASLQAQVNVSGFPTTLVRNTDYHEDTESAILVPIRDAEGNLITDIAGTAVADLNWRFGLGTEQSPLLVTGAASWEAGVGVKLHILAADTDGIALGPITWHVGVKIGTKYRWLGGGTTRLVERQFPE